VVRVLGAAILAFVVGAAIGGALLVAFDNGAVVGPALGLVIVTVAVARRGLRRVAG
jgi:uncharacterized membrane protein YoaK (UPF0700 family)